jgi:hypothetical protein
MQQGQLKLLEDCTPLPQRKRCQVPAVSIYISTTLAVIVALRRELYVGENGRGGNQQRRSSRRQAADTE